MENKLENTATRIILCELTPDLTGPWKLNEMPYDLTHMENTFYGLNENQQKNYASLCGGLIDTGLTFLGDNQRPNKIKIELYNQPEIKVFADGKEQKEYWTALNIKKNSYKHQTDFYGKESLSDIEDRRKPLLICEFKHLPKKRWKGNRNINGKIYELSWPVKSKIINEQDMGLVKKLLDSGENFLESKNQPPKTTRIELSNSYKIKVFADGKEQRTHLY